MSETGTRIIRIVTIVFLSSVIVTGGIIAWVRYDPGEEITLVPSDRTSPNGTVYIGGDVNLPGYYPFEEQDTIHDLIAAAGGCTADPDITLAVTSSEEAVQPQKIDINRADSWLLQALPGIGETLADRICTRRQEIGPFQNTLELLDVDGIGPAVYEKIEPFITVKDIADR